MSDTFHIQPGETAVLVSVPHAGTRVPASIAERLTPHARGLPDTDWFVDRLWSWVADRGVGLLVATHSRYVVDLNRPPDDTPLYSAATTGLVPETDFGGHSLYLTGTTLSQAEVASRRNEFWAPYHQVLASELERLRNEHGYAILLDAHSIASVVPWLFEGTLPHLNLGSYSGESAALALVEAAWQALDGGEHLDRVLNGRFKGGYTTRHYGRPDRAVHAIQLEVAQRAYMDEFTCQWDEGLAASFRPVQDRLLDVLTQWQPMEAENSHV